MTAEQMEKAGLVSKVVPADKVVETAVEIGTKIANQSKVSLLCIEAIVLSDLF